MAARPLTWAGQLVLVHLSQVPEARRLRAADRLIETQGLTGTAAMQIKMAAVHPVQDPAVYVPAELARRKGVRL